MITDEPRPTSKRSWWPIVAATALVTAAIVAVVVFTTGDDAAAPTTTASTPETTMVATTVPGDDLSVGLSGGCVEVAAAGETATGCFDTDDAAELAGRTLLARLDRLYEVTFDAPDGASGLAPSGAELGAATPVDGLPGALT